MEQLSLPVDEGKTNHGLYLSHTGDLLILNTNDRDGIELMRYDSATGNVALLEVSASSTRRNSFRLVSISDEQLYLAGVCENFSGLTGVMCTLFNFNAMRVDIALFFPIPKTLLDTIDKLPGEGSYSLLDFKPEEKGFTFELEEKYNSHRLQI